MSRIQLFTKYVARARAERGVGARIVIDLRFPSVEIYGHDIDGNEETKWFWQEHEAQAELDKVPDWIDAETFLLATIETY